MSVLPFAIGGLLAPDHIITHQRHDGGSCGGETWRVADVRMLVDPETGVTDCVVEPLLGRSGGYDVRQGDATF